MSTLPLRLKDLNTNANSYLTVPPPYRSTASRAISRALPGTPDGHPQVENRLPCIYCGTRRLPCDFRGPPCRGCTGRQDQSCTYEWRLGEHIYDLFPARMNLNGRLRITLQEFQHDVAHGGAARVYRTGTEEGGFFAVKVLFENRDVVGRQLQLATREAWTWYQLGHHENIIECTGIANLREIAEGGLDQLCLVSPWMEAGHITSYVNSHQDAKRMRLLWDIVKGVQYLHSKHATHGDLKGNNVLVDFSSGYPRARLTDFGASYVRESWEEAISIASSSKAYWGNVRWMAFERVSPQEWDLRGGRDANSPQSDIFEMMRTFLEVLTGKPPYQEVLDTRILGWVSARNNPSRPQDRVEGIDDKMWSLMMQAWSPDRVMRPNLWDIYDDVEARVLYEAIQNQDTVYLDAIDVTSNALQRFGRHVSPTVRATLLRYLCYRLAQSPEHLYNHDQFEPLLNEVLEILQPLSNLSFGLDQTGLEDENAELFKACFAFLGVFARFVVTMDATAWVLAVGGGVGLPTLVNGILRTGFLTPDDFHDILHLVLQEMEVSAEMRRPEVLDELLILMSRVMSMEGDCPPLDDCWKELARREFVHQELLERVHSDEESGEDWAVIFSNIVTWLRGRSVSDPECKELVSRLLAGAPLSKLVGHTSRENEAQSSLDRIAHILELRNGIRPINQEDLETILPFLCRHLEARSEFDELQECMRLFSLDDFRHGLDLLMTGSTPPDNCTLSSLSRILQMATFRLIANPFDRLFKTLATLPWISLIRATASHTATHDRCFIGILDNLSTGRSRVWKSPADELPQYQHELDGLDEYEHQVVLPLLARYLISSTDTASSHLCIGLVTAPSSKLGVSVVRAFTDPKTAELVFAASCRLWYWSYARSKMNTAQDELSRWFLTHVPLDQHISILLLPEMGQPRVDPLLRILAQRLDVQAKEDLPAKLVPLLLYCIQKHVSSQWVASEKGIVDIVRNEQVITAAFAVLNSRNENYAARSYAITVLVAAHRVTNGRWAVIQQQLSKLEIRTMEPLIAELLKHEQSLSCCWELLLYRLTVDLSRISESSASLLPRIIPQAVTQIGRPDNQAAYIALLVIQHLYQCLGANLSTFSSSLPAFISPKLPIWLANHKDEVSRALNSLPLVTSAGATITVNTSALASFRQTMRIQVVGATPIGSPTSPGGSLSPVSDRFPPIPPSPLGVRSVNSFGSDSRSDTHSPSSSDQPAKKTLWGRVKPGK